MAEGRVATLKLFQAQAAACADQAAAVQNLVTEQSKGHSGVRFQASGPLNPHNPRSPKKPGLKPAKFTCLLKL